MRSTTPRASSSLSSAVPPDCDHFSETITCAWRFSVRAAIAASARSASLTDVESGKASASSGPMRTTSTPRRYLFDVFAAHAAGKVVPRPHFTSAALEGGSFIVASLMLGCRASADYTDPLSSNSMNTIRRLRLLDAPTMTKRSSPMVWSGSEIVIESGSSKTVVASANPTPCLCWFDEFFLRSHSKGFYTSTSPG